jgi:cytochrome c-type biogenesis protein CcmH
MALWFVFALMTSAAVFAVLLPLGRSTEGKTGGSEMLVYKDQLSEIASDAASGLIREPEATAARVEIGRRLLAAASTEDAEIFTPRQTWRRAIAVVAFVMLPLMAIAIYAPLGSPRLPDFPLVERSQTATAATPLDKLVAQVEAHLETHPEDGRGWAVLAPVLGKLGRSDDAVQAYRNVIKYNGETAERRADLGEAMTMAANGIVTADAKTEFERAIAIDAAEVKARYYVGVAAEQDGRRAEAISIWRAMLDSGPQDAPWRPLVQSALVRVGAAAPQLSDDNMASAKGMTESDRNTMIRGMVERLATRLKDNADDVEGWLRLTRAYMVLGEPDKARSAVNDARQALARDGEHLRQLNDGIKSLGLDG